MITTLIISLVNLLLFTLGAILPTIQNPYPQEIINAWTLVTTQAVEWNNLVPVFDMFNALSIYVAAWTVLLSWYLIKWIIHLVRG